MLQGDLSNDEYKPQRQMQMFVTGAEWCDAVSFHPEFPAEHQLAICRTERDEEYIVNLEEALWSAEREAEEILKSIGSLEEAA